MSGARCHTQMYKVGNEKMHIGSLYGRRFRNSALHHRSTPRPKALPEMQQKFVLSLLFYVYGPSGRDSVPEVLV